MTLPSIVAPAGTPVFLAAGHGIEEDSVYASVAMASGHSRQRRRWTVTERVVSVSWALTTAQLAAVDEWFHTDLEKGSLEFAAQVANQGDTGALLWWTARWVEPIETQMMPGFGGMVTGTLLLVGDGSVDGPES